MCRDRSVFRNEPKHTETWICCHKWLNISFKKHWFNNVHCIYQNWLGCNTMIVCVCALSYMYVCDCTVSSGWAWTSTLKLRTKFNAKERKQDTYLISACAKINNPKTILDNGWNIGNPHQNDRQKTKNKTKNKVLPEWWQNVRKLQQTKELLKCIYLSKMLPMLHQCAAMFLLRI